MKVIIKTIAAAMVLAVLMGWRSLDGDRSDYLLIAFRRVVIPHRIYRPTQPDLAYRPLHGRM